MWIITPNLTEQIEVLDTKEARCIGVSSVTLCDKQNHTVFNPEKNQIVW